jgi:hypothetical protein
MKGTQQTVLISPQFQVITMKQQHLADLVTAAVTQATAGLVQEVQDLQQQVQQANAAAAAIASSNEEEGKQEEPPTAAAPPLSQHFVHVLHEHVHDYFPHYGQPRGGPLGPFRPTSATAFDTQLDTFQEMHKGRGPFVRIPTQRQSPALGRIYDAIGELGWIGGGCVRWLCSPNKNPIPPGDVDIFMRSNDPAKLEQMLENLYALGYATQHTSAMAINMRKAASTYDEMFAINLQVVLPRKGIYIRTYAGTPEELAAHLDFSVSRAVLVSHSEAIVDADFMADEVAMRLNIKHIVCPVSSIHRLTKYSRKGYKANALQSVKLLAEWSARAKIDHKGEIAPVDVLAAFSNDGPMSAQVALGIYGVD